MPRPPVLLALVLVAASATAQTSIHVSASAPAGGDGTCERPFAEVAEGLAAAAGAATPVTLRLAGTFAENGLTISTSGLTLQGGHDANAFAAGCTDASVQAAWDPAAHPTTLDGDVDGDARGDGRIADVAPGTTDVRFEHLTFLRGRAGAGAAGPLPPRDGSGGALRILNAQRVAIVSCTFRGNQTTQHQAAGGAIFAAAFPQGAAQPGVLSLTITGSRFQSNVAGDGTTGSGVGGAIAAWDLNAGSGLPATATVDASDNAFVGNASRGSGPLDAATWCTGWDAASPPQANLDCNPRDGASETCGSRALGGAVELQDAGGRWERNEFDSNTSQAHATGAIDFSGQGGAIASLSTLGVVPPQQPVLTNNVFRANVAAGGAGSATACGVVSGWGGAAYLLNFGSQVTDNVFEENVADASRVANPALQVGSGGALAIAGQGPLLIARNQFRGNEARGGRGSVYSGTGGAVHVQDGFAAGRPVITNNVFESNAVTGSQAATAYGGALFLISADALLARNAFTGNSAEAPAGLVGGIGGAAWNALAGGLVADNVLTGNRGSNVAGAGGNLRFAGMTFIGALPGNPTAAPRVQNNLAWGNDGVGFSAVGFPADLDGDGVATVPDEVFYCAPEMRNNTSAFNAGPGIATNQADGMRFEGNVLWNNDTSRSGFGDWLEGFLGNPSPGIVVERSCLSSWNASVDDSVRAPANANLLGIDPQFVDAPGGDFHLRQAPDQAGAASPLVDAGGADATAVDYGPGEWDQRGDGVLRRYDADGLAGEDTMASGTTRSVTRLADEGPVDVGWHSQASAAADSDGDGLLDGEELTAFLDPFDADTDDDGLRDGDESLGDTDGDAQIDAADCDSDGDGLGDGLESGVTTGTADTDPAIPCVQTGRPAFVADADPASRTNGLVRDTDGDGCEDGAEDADGNGRVDPGESDPSLAAGCAPAVELRINDAIVALRGGASAACGPRTQPALHGQLDASGACVADAGCDAPSVRPTRTVPWTGAEVTLLGEAAPGGPALLLLEVDGCPGILEVSRAGSDLIVLVR